MFRRVHNLDVTEVGKADGIRAVECSAEDWIPRIQSAFNAVATRKASKQRAPYPSARPPLMICNFGSNGLNKQNIKAIKHMTNKQRTNKNNFGSNGSVGRGVGAGSRAKAAFPSRRRVTHDPAWRGSGSLSIALSRVGTGRQPAYIYIYM